MAVDVVKATPTQLTVRRGMSDYDVGIFSLRKTLSGVSWLSPRLFIEFATLTFGLPLQAITTGRLAAIRAVFFRYHDEGGYLNCYLFTWKALSLAGGLFYPNSGNRVLVELPLAW
jgi:hypothetical protein